MAWKRLSCLAFTVVICVITDILISRKVIRISMSNYRERQHMNYTGPHVQATTNGTNGTWSQRLETALTPRPNPKRYLTERELLADGSFLHTKDMADALFSTVNIIGDRSSFSLGEIIKVQIDLLKGENDRKHIGGDYVRLWMEDKTNGAFVSGDVIDHGNGSYTGVLKALWVGQANIRVFLAGTREEILLYYKLYRLYSSIWTINAGFGAGEVSERTHCSTSAFDGDQCNMTSWNGGLPWFCKKPSTEHLGCDTWRTTSSKVRADFYLDSKEKDIYEM
ncbi:NXPE family member 1-like [Haliotis rubra]|uniref:NXPE family member 1-like n=1 Tax=Haliotis rubra TaxID=36100 RepID=UPI001EE5B620|nr:NXPE family member 1-like [Haliotis rubra]